MEEMTSQNFLRRNYHWLIAAVAFLEAFIAIGFANNLYTLFMIPVMTAELFGRRDFGSLLGIQQAILSLGSMLSMPLMNLIYEAQGSYITGFYILLAFSVAALGLYLSVFWGARWERSKYEAARQRRLANVAAYEAKLAEKENR